jgi:hypothetical protein
MNLLLARYPILVSPVTWAVVATVVAVATSLLLGVQDASAGASIHR